MVAIAAGWERNWLTQMNLNAEGTVANFYSSILWASVAVLGLAQLRRSAAVPQPRWLWTLGWLSVGCLGVFVAVEEVAGLKDPTGASFSIGPEWLQEYDRWTVAVAPLAVPLAATAGRNLYLSQRSHSTRMLLTVLAIVVVAAAIVHDLLHSFYTSNEFAWGFFAEEGSEVMAGALLIVVLTETLMAAEPSGRERQNLRMRRWAALGVVVTLLGVIGSALLANHGWLLTKHEWIDGNLPRPTFYAGPVSLVTQPFRAKHDYMFRVDVQAFVEGGAPPAEVFARLIPQGTDQPVRESRTEVQGGRFSAETISFEFEPIPDSGRQWYTLAIGILGGPTPWVFLGLTGVDAIPESGATVNGVPDGRDLAMRTRSIASFGRIALENRRGRLLQVAGVVLVLFLWVCATVAVWGGLSGDRQRSWGEIVWGVAQTGALITASALAIGIALLSVL